MRGGNSGNTAWRGLAALVLALVATEIACYAFFTTFHDRFTFYDVERLTLPENKLERAARIFDPRLGWRRFFDTPHGERPRPRRYGRPLLATYGDSFTYGEQVGYRDTYQTHLAEILGGDVYNFGHGGWGTDQAYLHFRDRDPEPRTPLVSIGLITENINRIVNVFRPFYAPRTALALSKPRFLLRDGSLELLPNPVREVGELRNLGDPDFVRSLAEHDWWYNRDDLPELVFPYSAILWNRHLWREALGGDDAGDDVDARPWHDLWEVEEARTLMHAILDRFHDEVRASGATPIVILSPRRGEVVRRLDGVALPKVDRVIDFCRAREYRCFDGVTEMAAALETRDDVHRFFDHHLTAEGNRAFAERLARWLVDQGLVDGASEPTGSTASSR